MNVPPGITTPVPPRNEFTPDALASAENLTNKQLVWGRYFASNSTDLERITVLWDVASTDRAIASGNDVYGLFRTKDGTGEVQRGLGALGFNLYQAQAVLRTGDQSDLMNVTGGMLNIDFEQNLFSTNLQMNHAATGNVEFSESGRVFAGGIFHSSNSNGTPSMSGAVSLDGTQAGYFFEKTVEAGVIEGLTLWGVKP